jgi:hypothetical protein
MRCAPGQGTQTTLTFRFGAEWALAYEMPGSAWVPIASTLPVRAYLELQRVEVGLKGIVMGERGICAPHVTRRNSNGGGKIADEIGIGKRRRYSDTCRASANGGSRKLGELEWRWEGASGAIARWREGRGKTGHSQTQRMLCARVP